jgi:hypothetical protein
LSQKIVDVDLGTPTTITLTTGLVVTNAITADQNASAGNTRFLLWDVSQAKLQRVSIGVNDSGGAGYRVLRIPN